MPSYLNKEHLQILVGKMKDWEVKMEQVIGQVETKATELLQKWFIK